MDRKKLAVLSPSFALTSIVAVSAALAGIAEAFPDVSISAVQMLTALPSLIAIAVILLSGLLASRVTKKKIVAVSMCLMLLGGTMPLLFHRHYYQLLAASILFGLGFGGISPLTTALIHEHYTADEQPAMLGFQSAVIGIGGVLFSYLGGKLAAGCWWHVYYVFFLFVPILLLVLTLPRGSVAPRSADGGARGLWNRRLFFYMGQSVLFSTFFFAFQSNAALLIAARGLGGADVAGRVLSTQSACGILTGILGGRILKSLRERALPVIFLCSGGALLLIFVCPGLTPLFLATAVLGGVFSLRMPAGYLKATGSVPPDCATLAITLYCSASQIGQFLSPLCVNGLSALLSPGLAGKFLLNGAALVLIGLYSLFYEKRAALRRD